MNLHERIAEVIKFASDAAKEHVELARFSSEEPDPETSMGLWQCFQANFPKPSNYAVGSDYDLLVTVYSQTYTATVKTLIAFRPDGGKAEFNCKEINERERR